MQTFDQARKTAIDKLKNASNHIMRKRGLLLVEESLGVIITGLMDHLRKDGLQPLSTNDMVSALQTEIDNVVKLLEASSAAELDSSFQKSKENYAGALEEQKRMETLLAEMKVSKAKESNDEAAVLEAQASLAEVQRQWSNIEERKRDPKEAVDAFFLQTHQQVLRPYISLISLMLILQNTRSN